MAETPTIRIDNSAETLATLYAPPGGITLHLGNGVDMTFPKPPEGRAYDGAAIMALYNILPRPNPADFLLP